MKRNIYTKVIKRIKRQKIISESQQRRQIAQELFIDVRNPSYKKVSYISKPSSKKEPIKRPQISPIPEPILYYEKKIGLLKQQYSSPNKVLLQTKKEIYHLNRERRTLQKKYKCVLPSVHLSEGKLYFKYPE